VTTTAIYVPPAARYSAMTAFSPAPHVAVLSAVTTPSDVRTAITCFVSTVSSCVKYVAEIYVKIMPSPVIIAIMRYVLSIP